MNDDQILYTYTGADKQGSFIPGVPTHDLTVAEFNELPDYLQAFVSQSDCYELAS